MTTTKTAFSKFEVARVPDFSARLPWIDAEARQCGTPSNSGTTFTFSLTRDGQSCARNQANPITTSGSLVNLDDGATYVWSFGYVDGKPNAKGREWVSTVMRAV